jgi:hypothetical protein
MKHESSPSITAATLAAMAMWTKCTVVVVYAENISACEMVMLGRLLLLLFSYHGLPV